MHAGPAELYFGTGGRGVPDMPSPMYRTQVDCIACHKARQKSGEVADVAGQTFVTMQASCDACHGSNLPKHMASEVPFEGSDWPLPIGFEKTPTGGRCAPGCHKALAYDREHPTSRPTTRGAG